MPRPADWPDGWVAPIGDHPLDEYAIAARRHALDVEEQGLAGLVPVDRIIATIGGLIGGTATALVVAGAVLSGRRIRWPRIERR